jgi:hypothetical protein
MIFKHRWLARLALLAASTIATLAACELALSLFGPAWLRSRSKSLEEQLEESEASLPDPSRSISMRGLMRASSNPRLIFELKPGLRARFQEKIVTVNKHGYRGRVVPRQRHTDAVRIVGLGDSVMFGWGVGDNETFMAVLERSLNARRSGKRYEIVNLAVPGYNTLQEATQLETIGILYHPDIVLISYLYNDGQLPAYVASPKRGKGLIAFVLLYELMNEGVALAGPTYERDRNAFWADPKRVPP